MADMLFRAPIQYEVKTQNRWVLRFPSDIGIQEWALKSCDAPKLALNKKEMNFLNTKTYFNGSFAWNPMNVTLRDFIAPSMSEALMEWVRLQAESATGRMGYTVGVAKTVELLSLDPAGAETQKWKLVNTIITDTVDFGSRDYAVDEVVEITFTMQPQQCLLMYG